MIPASVVLIYLVSLLSVPRCVRASPESELLQLINQFRVENGREPLRVSRKLAQAALAHSRDMAQNDFFSHTGSDGSSPVDRARRAGYTYNTCIGENIAAGFSTAREVFEAWKSSPGHRRLMLDPCFKVAGVGRAYNPDSTYKWYWTADFGGFDDTSSDGGSPPPPQQSPSSPSNTPTLRSAPVPWRRIPKMEVSIMREPYNISDVVQVAVDTDIAGVEFVVRIYLGSNLVSEMEVESDRSGDILFNLTPGLPGEWRIVVEYPGGMYVAPKKVEKVFSVVELYRVEIEWGFPLRSILLNGSVYLSNGSVSLTLHKGDTLKVSLDPVIVVGDRAYLFWMWTDGSRSYNRTILVDRRMKVKPIFIETVHIPS